MQQTLFFSKKLDMPMNPGMKNITSTLALSLIFLSACRFGNHLVLAPPQQDGASGYYATTASRLNLHATTTETTTREASPLQAPTDFTAFFPNPVALTLLDPSTGSSAIFPPGGSRGFPILIDLKTLSISFLGGMASPPLWMDTECQLTTEIEVTGQIQKNTSPALHSSPPLSSSYPLAGRLSFTLQVIHQLQGPCEDSLNQLALCYEDMTQCGGQNTEENKPIQDRAKTLLRPWVEAGTIDPLHFRDLQNFAYELTYE